MTLTLALRREAEAEAARLRAIKTCTGAPEALSRPGIPVTSLGRTSDPQLDAAGAIFFVRIRIADAAGRLLENCILAAGVPLPRVGHGRKRREVRSHAQHLVDRFGPSVVDIVRKHAAGRVAALAGEYGLGLERAFRREHRLAEIAAGDAADLVQAGLFDRRWLKEQEANHRSAPVSSTNRDARVGLLSTQLVLILILANHS